MKKVFNPGEIEQKSYQTWEANHYFQPTGNGSPYCIVLPPPNVTGTLHMGHGFQHTLMDILTRYHRMCGDNTLWQPGTDHAGIATQMVVENQLNVEGKTRHDLGRKKFIDRVWEWKQESGGKITQQMRRLGVSVDWERECFTMDAHMSDAVVHAFEKLYDDGLIYRGKRLINWDPTLHTALSDLEVINTEESGHLWHIRYPLADDDPTRHLTVATTRPETMLGDVAVAVHPDDERYQQYIGKSLLLPLTDRTIPIIADDYVDPEFGSGCVKITPAHDFNDYEIGQHHELPLINILTPDAHINENAPARYHGLDRFEARKKIIKDLKQADLLAGITEHRLQIPRSDRSHSILEPYLTEQWYIDIKPLAAPAIEVIKNKKLKFIPGNWDKTYFQWMENIQDWCISRQLWWGHQIPAWYDDEGKVYVGLSEEAVRIKHNLKAEVNLTQETDVLDTWFSSALWPFSTLGWPEKTKTLETFYPTQVLVTGFDIIFFWVARMIMFGIYFTGKVPFKEVYITGLIRDEKGQKMSKSKGNILDPIDLIDGISLEALLGKRTYGLMQPDMKNKITQLTNKQFPQGITPSGTDALRFTLCALASTGRNINLDPKRLEGYRNFCNKLWNAARFVLIHTEDKPLPHTDEEIKLSSVDHWIISRLEETTAKCHKYLASYRFDLLAQTLYEFVWHDYCDWYLELTKPILTAEGADVKQQAATRKILLDVLECILRLLHPIIPFITETIWQQVTPMLNLDANSIMTASYPEHNPSFINKAAEAEITWLQQVISSIRTVRAEMGISPKQSFELYIRKGDASDDQFLEHNKSLLSKLAKVSTINHLKADEKLSATALVPIGSMEILIPIGDFVDISAERERLNKQIKKLEKDHALSEKKLNNKNYVSNAPTEVVALEKEKFEHSKQRLIQLQQQLSCL